MKKKIYIYSGMSNFFKRYSRKKERKKKSRLKSKPEINWEEYTKRFEEKLKNKSCAIYVRKQEKRERFFFLIGKS